MVANTLGLFTAKSEFLPCIFSAPDEIDAAIKRGRKLGWEKGLLAKELNICHGIIGNALALAASEQDRFLALTTPDKIEEGIEAERFKKGDDAYGMLWDMVDQTLAWMDAVDDKDGGVVFYTDV